MVCAKCASENLVGQKDKSNLLMKKKQTKADFIRQWGLPAGFRYHHLRYVSPPEKGILWHYFSLYIRNRDVKKYGTCISCGRAIDVETSNAGHFMPASSCGRDLIFDERNVNAECAQCNAWDETHLLGYAEGLDERYGKGTAQSLRDRREAYQNSQVPIKDWNRATYSEMVHALILKSNTTQ